MCVFFFLSVFFFGWKGGGEGGGRGGGRGLGFRRLEKIDKGVCKDNGRETENH